jgi:hypothetical protein
MTPPFVVLRSPAARAMGSGEGPQRSAGNYGAQTAAALRLSAGKRGNPRGPRCICVDVAAGLVIVVLVEVGGSIELDHGIAAGSQRSRGSTPTRSAPTAAAAASASAQAAKRRVRRSLPAADRDVGPPFVRCRVALDSADDATVGD